MWIFITLLWRITSRLLRRLGWGSLLVPVALLGVPELAGWLDGAGITSAQIDEALDPSGYLGSAGAFTDAALGVHARRQK